MLHFADFLAKAHVGGQEAVALCHNKVNNQLCPPPSEEGLEGAERTKAPRCNSEIPSAETLFLFPSPPPPQKVTPRPCSESRDPCLVPRTRRSELVLIFHTSLYLQVCVWLASAHWAAAAAHLRIFFTLPTFPPFFPPPPSFIFLIFNFFLI